ncbi:MAG: 2Fe-2S iron-sulfur cluster-binding protein, partial [Candidatus Omnitrophica bacterium]|nr:2Fe-2S iron-sulfur cluster-binding protein [Candidatus Omnitrophota bacterium]
MIMSAKDLLERNPEPTQEDIEYALDGNLCRCGGYPKIFDAVRQAGYVMKLGHVRKEVDSKHAGANVEKIVMGITYEEFLRREKENQTS